MVFYPSVRKHLRNNYVLTVDLCIKLQLLSVVSSASLTEAHATDMIVQALWFSACCPMLKSAFSFTFGKFSYL